MQERKWWSKSTVYQIYPRSFKDSNNDGIGDLAGITSKLDYLKNLGIDIIWISPFFKSPNVDNGYDISDYRDINPEYGTMEDMKELIREADARGMKIIMDLVANHCSDQHEWFKQALKGKDNPYRNYFIWRDPVEGKEPNGLTAGFSGSAWQYDDKSGQYYLHLFSIQQPDLNWENSNVRKEIYDIMNFWIDKGIYGFRMDVIELIGKEVDSMVTSNGKNLHKYIKEMNKATFGPKGLFTVGECWNATADEALKYMEGDELDMVFQFDHVSLDQKEGGSKWDLAPLDLVKLKRTFMKWQKFFSEKGWYALVWDNHDLPRIVSRYGNDGQYHKESAKMLALVLHMMKGTPYVYQGEEIGMTNIRFDSIEDYDDIEAINYYKFAIKDGKIDKETALKSVWAKGRDNARTPFQWDSSRYAGFSNHEPWMKVNPNKDVINAESQIGNPDSIFSFYKKLIALRKSEVLGDLLIDGDFNLLLEEDKDLFCYERKYKGQHLLVIANFHESPRNDAPAAPEDATLIISNYPDDRNSNLRAYEAKAYLY